MWWKKFVWQIWLHFADLWICTEFIPLHLLTITNFDWTSYQANIFSFPVTAVCPSALTLLQRIFCLPPFWGVGARMCLNLLGAVNWYSFFLDFITRYSGQLIISFNLQTRVNKCLVCLDNTLKVIPATMKTYLWIVGQEGYWTCKCWS